MKAKVYVDVQISVYVIQGSDLLITSNVTL